MASERDPVELMEEAKDAVGIPDPTEPTQARITITVRLTASMVGIVNVPLDLWTNKTLKLGVNSIGLVEQGDTYNGDTYNGMTGGQENENEIINDWNGDSGQGK